jgi:hypothetical protein
MGYQNKATFDVCVTFNNDAYLFELAVASIEHGVNGGRMAALFWLAFAFQYGHHFVCDMVETMNNPEVNWDEVYTAMKTNYDERVSYHS